MPVAAEALVADLPEEFTGPVGYADRWLWIAVGLVVALVAYYLLAWRLTRAPARLDAAPAPAPDARAEHLARIDRVDALVRAGELTPRDGHQQLSEVVRDYVAAVTSLPARTMALADFREHAPAALADVIELVYPPEFSPDDTVARERFETAVGRSRGLVTTWGAG